MNLKPLRAWRGSVLAVLSVVAALAIAACGSSGSNSTGGSGSSTPAAASTPGGSTTSGSAHNLSLTIGYIGTQGVFTGPEGFAYEKGLMQKWLAADGITSLKSAQFANGPLLNAAMVGGSVDVGLVGDTPALIAKSESAPTRVINQEELHLASWVIAKKPISSLSQLQGKAIARQQGSYMDRYVQGLLQQKGLSGKVNLTPMLFAQAIPAFNAGSLDALVIIPTLAPLIKQPYNVVAKSSQDPALEGTGVTVVTNKVLQEDPQLPSVWNKMRVKAIQYAKAHQSAYYAFEAKAEQTTPALAKQYFPLSDNPTAPFTSVGLRSLQSTLNFLVQTNQAKNFSIDAWKAS